MNLFDVGAPYWVTPEYAESRIQTAWIGQCLSNSWISSLIRYGTQGVHSHSQMFLRNGGNKLDVLEIREFIGGRRNTFNFQVKQNMRIDVFSYDPQRWPEFDPQKATDAMRTLTDCDYGWMGILSMAMRRIPLAWHMYPPTTDDRLPSPDEPIRQPFCSHAVCLATQIGGVDPVPRCPNWLVTPSQLTFSLFYQYEFSIANPWSVRYYGDTIMEEAIRNSQEGNDGN